MTGKMCNFANDEDLAKPAVIGRVGQRTGNFKQAVGLRLWNTTQTTTGI